MLKAIILAALLGMLLPVVGHFLSRNVTNQWQRFGVSVICLFFSILVTYIIALIFHW